METTEFNNAQAMQEGWAIFDCNGDGGRWQLQRIDEDEKFPSDDEAWTFVTDKARSGSAYHRCAIEYLRDHNPGEYALIQKATGYSG